MGEVLKNHCLGSICLKHTFFVVLVTQQRGDWKRLTRCGERGDGKIGDYCLLVGLAIYNIFMYIPV